MADEISSVKTVVQVLNDGSKGFADIGEQIEDAKVKQFFSVRVADSCSLCQ